MNLISDVLLSSNALLVFGVASGVLSTVAYIPYILDTIAKRTHPQRASWLIWSVLGSIAFISQIYEGATSSLWFAGVQVTGTIIVFLLSIKRGNGRFLSKNDYAILAAAGVGLVLWYFTENAAYALAITISISLLGGLATAVKAFHDPDSETLSTWIISFIASGCAMLSVGKVDFVLLAYPVYLFTLYLSFIVAIALGRARRSVGTLAPALSAIARPARAILRTTADGVIVITALLYVINNGLPFVATEASAFNGTLPQEETASQRGRIDSDSASELATADASSLTDRSPENLNREPLALSMIGLAAAADDPPKHSAPEQFHDTLGQPFLTLDADDPFNALVVVSASASMLNGLTTPQLSTKIPQGESLLALATNGEWFKVSTANGTLGYVHRSVLRVTLPELSRQS